MPRAGLAFPDRMARNPPKDRFAPAGATVSNRDGEKFTRIIILCQWQSNVLIRLKLREYPASSAGLVVCGILNDPREKGLDTFKKFMLR